MITMQISRYMVATSFLVCARLSACSTSYTDAAADAVNVYAWTILTDNYTDSASSCAPGGWSNFTHTYTVSAHLQSPSSRTANGTTYNSAGAAYGPMSTRADAYISLSDEEGTFLIEGTGRIDCSVAGYGFVNAVVDLSAYIAIKRTYFKNTGGSQVISGTRFCGYTPWCGSVTPACGQDGVTGQVAASQSCPVYYQASFVTFRTSTSQPFTCTISLNTFTNQSGSGFCDQ